MKYAISGHWPNGQHRVRLMYNPDVGENEPSTEETLKAMRPVWNRERWFTPDELRDAVDKAVERGEIVETEQLHMCVDMADME